MGEDCGEWVSARETVTFAPCPPGLRQLAPQYPSPISG